MADGTINIDVLLHKERFLPDYESIKKLLVSLGKGTGDKMDEDFSSNADGMTKKAQSAHSKIKDELSKTIEQVLNLDDKEFNGKVSDVKRKTHFFKNPIKQKFEADFSSFNRGINDALSEIKELREKAGGIKGILKDSAIGSFIGNTLANGVSSVTDELTGLVGEAAQASDSMDKFKSTMKLGGFGEKEINATSKEVKKYADETVYELSDVSNTTAQLAANGVKGYMGLTEAAGNLNAQAGGNADTFKSVAMMLTQTAGAGKLTTENWNQLADAIPGASGKLQEAMKKNGAFTGNFRDAMAEGQITSDEFNKAISQLGSNDGAVKAAKSTSTFEGAFGSMQANVVSGIKDIIDHIGKSKMTGIVNMLSDSLNGVFGLIMDGLDYLSGHKDDLKSIGDSVWNIVKALGKGAWDGITGFFKLIPNVKGDGIEAISNGLKEISKHRGAVEDVGKALVTYFVAKKLFSTAQTIWSIASAIKSIASIPVNGIKKVMDAVLSSSTASFSVKDAGALTRGERFGTTAGESGILSGMASKLMPKNLAPKMLEFGKGIGGKLVAGLGVALSAFDLFKAFNTKDKSKKAESAGKGIGGLLGAGIGFALGGPAGMAIGNVIGSLAGGWAVKATKKFSSGWNAWAKGYKPHGIIATVAFDTREALFKLNNFTAKVEKKHPKIAPVIRIADGTIKALWHAIEFPMKTFTTSFSLAGKEASDLFSGRFDKMWPDFVKTSKSFLGSVVDDAKNVWDTITGNRHTDSKPKSKGGKGSSKGKTSTEEAIEDVATVHVSKKDIANVKAMIPVMKDYEDALGNLKSFLKKHDPTTDLKAMNKRLKGSVDGWDKLSKPIKKIGSAFKSLNSFAKEMKSDPFSKLNKDLPKLDKTLKNNKIGSSLKKLKSDLKKNDPSKELKKISKEIKGDAKDWNKLSKPIATLAKSFKTLAKSMKSIEKDKGLSKLNKDLDNLEKTAKKTKFGTEIKKQIDVANKAVGNTGFIKVFHTMTNSIVSDLKRFKSNFKRDWENLWKEAASDEKKNNNKIEDDYSDSTKKLLKLEGSFSNSFEKTFKSLGNSLRSIWKSVWKDISDLSNSGMHKTAGYINSGIQGIDYVLGKFGGSPATIAPIKFASGTGLVENGRLTRGTLAMLNDGNDSPETGNVERVIKADGRSYEPAGNNVMRYLEAGDAVLNASENKMFKMSGLTHFAEGTGIFNSALFKGVNGGYQQLIELAERLSSNVNKSFAALFTGEPKVKGDVPKAFESIFKKQTDKQGQKWWATVWDVINQAIGGASGDATGLLKAVEKYGTGKPYVWGATGPNSFDCSGLVMYALKQAFGISYPHFSGDQIAKTQHISASQARPGDLLGNDEHIGVYMGNGYYWSAMSPSSHPNIGKSPVSTFPGTPIWGRVRGLKVEDDKKKDTKADKGLTGLVKKELGSGVFSFIKKHLAPLVEDDSGVGTASGGTVTSDLIKRAAQIAGVSVSASDMKHIQNVVQHESGGNSKVVNNWDSNAKAGHPSKGILQFIDSTFRHYAMPGHGNILSALDQLVAMFNDTTWRSDLTLGGWGPTGAVRHANGGWGQWGKLNIFNEVPGEPEVAINPSRDSADSLIMETIAERLQKSPNGKLARALSTINHVSEQAHQFAGKAIANVQNSANNNNGAMAATDGGNIKIVTNLDGKTIADATYPINQARQARQINLETKKKGGFH
ncbi:tape measure protein [Pediococcus pentosaceus]|uniref:tape measure protein n=1 Tax=Pediococcus pentosaceus TaxID=1255 RepID=UPI001C7D8CF4|nr:tape measure protein [Pediococcus pentosaceus]QYY86101.1 tape measure protein [Pediococcus pentosaceus]